MRWSLSLCLSTQSAPTPRCRHRKAPTRSGDTPAPVITSHGSGCPHTRPDHAHGTTAGHGTLKITGAKSKKRADTPLEDTEEVSHGGSRARFTSTQHPVLTNKDHSERQSAITSLKVCSRQLRRRAAETSAISQADAAGTAGPAASSATSAVWALVSSKNKEKMPRLPSHPLFTDFVVRMTTGKANLLTKSSKRI